MNPITTQNLSKAFIYSKIEESKKYDECMYLLAIQIFEKERTISSRMIREQLYLDYDQSIKLMERVRIDYINTKDKVETKNASNSDSQLSDKLPSP